MTRPDVVPPTSGARRSIAIEDVLNSRTRLSDLARTLLALFDEMPARATAIAGPGVPDTVRRMGR